MNQIKYLFLGIKDCRRFLLGTETILQIQPYSEILQTYNYLENLNMSNITVTDPSNKI